MSTAIAEQAQPLVGLLDADPAPAVGDGPGGVLDALGRIEALKAMLDATAVALTGVLVEHVSAVAESWEDPAASEHRLACAREEARGALADEVALATGLGVGAARDLVEVAAAPASRARGLRAELAAGRTSWARVRTIWHATAELPDGAVQDIAARVFAPAPSGGPVSHEAFRRRLRRGVCRHSDAPARRARTREKRACRLETWPDGAGCLSLTGPLESLVGAFERIDALARAVRHEGDPHGRTLDQLRFDIGAGLLAYGQPTRLPETDTTDAVAVEPEGMALATTSPTGETRVGEAPGKVGVVGGDAVLSAVEVLPGLDARAATTGAHEFGTCLAAAFPAGVLPVASVTVVVSAASLLGVTDDPGEIPGHGFLGASTVRDLAHAAGSTWRRLVTDPATGYAMSTLSPSYRPPPRMARAVHDRDAHCRFPGCTHPPERSDLDHVTPHPAGPTTPTNLQVLHRRHHRHKTRRLWRATMTPDGTLTWTTPLGRVHVTTPFDYRTDFPDPTDATDPTPTTSTATPAAATDPGPPPF